MRAGLQAPIPVGRAPPWVAQLPAPGGEKRSRQLQGPSVFPLRRRPGVETFSKMIFHLLKLII